MNALAEEVIVAAKGAGVMIATAESCTGGMIGAALTDVAGSSAVVDRGFITYSNEAKAQMLGVPLAHTQDPGAVSALVAREMVAGALSRSNAQLAVAVTGIAGPGGGSEAKPVGLVFLAVQRAGTKARIEECHFADLGAVTRADVRRMTVEKALNMLLEALG
ncbi:MAG: CinA family protein [Pseudomonadota bacterium]